MSSNVRPSTNVGAGSLREPDEQEFTVNEGWDFFQKYLPDDSVINSKPFEIFSSDLKGGRTFRIVIPKYPGQFLNPSTLRLNGKCKIVYIQNDGQTASKLPQNSAAFPDPFGNFPPGTWAVDPEIKDAEVDAELKKGPAGPALKRGSFPVTYKDGTANAEKVHFIKYTHSESVVGANEVAQVVPVNLFPQALWKDIDIQMNEIKVTNNANLSYAHKAYLETILTYGEEALQTHMQAEMWMPDDDYEIAKLNMAEEKVENKADRRKRPFDTDYCKTKSFYRKAKKFSENNAFRWSMMMHTELNSIHSFLPDNICYEFNFVRHEPQFFLRSYNGVNLNNGRYDVEIQDLSISGEFMIPSKPVLDQLSSFMNKQDPILRTNRTEILTSQVGKDLSYYEFRSIFPGNVLPDQIFVALVNQSALQGDLTRDPFYFHHYNLQSVQMTVNNNNLPVNPYTPDWEKDDYARAYRALFENTAIKINNAGLSITPHRFKWGSTIFAWDLNHDRCAGAHSNHSTMYGQATLRLQFKERVGEQVGIIVAGVFRDYLAFDQWRKPRVINSHGVMELLAGHKMDHS